jgi:hypothetical protein
MRLVFVLSTLSFGCAHISDKEYADRLSEGEGTEDCETLTVFYADADGDGYGNLDNPVEACEQGENMANNSEDCDDTDAAMFPGAVWSADTDGDGFGDEDNQTESCSPADGYTGITGDCDDEDSSVNPAAQEDCASAWDDDCSGDTNDADALGCTAFFADADADGYGGESSACLCEASEAFPEVEQLDCDDEDASISPDAEEVCDDGVDNDCDGAAIGCGLSTDLSLGDTEIHFVGGTGSATGSRLAYGEDITGDGEVDLLIGGYQASQLMVTSGPSLDGTPTSTLSGDPEVWLSRDIATGDLNDDGAPDLILGGPRASFGSRSQGGLAAVYWGPVAADRDLNEADVTIWGPDGNAYLGRNLAVGDVSGDGADDLLVGALAAKYTGTRVGMVAIVEGPIASEVLDTAVYDDASARIYGTTENDKFGVELVADGDWTGDGLPDLLVGARFANTNMGGLYGFESGVALSGDVAAVDADLLIVGTGDLSRTGESLDVAGDIDGDGKDDLIVGAPERNLEGTGRGAVYLILDMTDGEIEEIAFAEIQGLLDGGNFGQSVSVIGDVDGSGIGIGVGAPGEGKGKVFLFGGGLSGTYISDDAIGRVLGADFGGRLGSALLGNIDYDGDGLLDLIVGADGGGLADGEVAVFLGGGL